MGDFEKKNEGMIRKMAGDAGFARLSREWFEESLRYEYSYHFKWLGRPIIQYPADVMAMQELIWEVKPDLIVETGIARGGSLIFYASMLALCGGDRRIVGIDIDIRPRNREEIEKHPMFERITLIEGSSVSCEVADRVMEIAAARKKIMVILDSNHTHDHVLRELELYSPLVKKGSYLVVFDTIIEWMPEELSSDRPWGKGNNPMTAVQEFLKTNRRFEIDGSLEEKLVMTVAPRGFLRCIED